MTNYFGNDLPNNILGSVLADQIYGYAGNDTLDGNTGANGDVIYGGGDNDRLFLSTTTNNSALGATAFGENGNDTVSGSIYKDLIYGDLGADSLLGSSESDTIAGTNQAGDTGDAGDNIRGEAGNDILYGNTGNDQLQGGLGNDTIYGGQNEDNLVGDGGNDRLFGDLGNDALRGLAGSDIMTGGSGNDTFHIPAPLQNVGDLDVITDFAGDLTTNIIDSLNIAPQAGVDFEARGLNGDMYVKAISATQQVDFLIVQGRANLVGAFNAAYRMSNPGTDENPELAAESPLDALYPIPEPSPDGTPTPLEVMQEAVEALKAGKPIPESNPFSGQPISIESLQTQIDDILGAPQGLEILKNSVNRTLPEGTIDPLTGSPVVVDKPLKIYTPEQLAEIDKILETQEEGIYFDGEEYIPIQRGWRITAPDFQGQPSISYGGLIFTNPDFDPYYEYAITGADSPTFDVSLI